MSYPRRQPGENLFRRGVFVERLTCLSVMLAKRRAGVAPCPGKKIEASSSPGTPASGDRGKEVPSSSGNPTSGDPNKESLPVKHAVLVVEKQRPPWIVELIKYLQDHLLPENDKEAECIACQAKMYVLIDSDLYR